MPIITDEEWLPIDETIKAGRFANALWQIRESTGCGLKTAMEHLHARQAVVKARLKDPPATPQ